jgi:hypothetical protein
MRAARCTPNDAPPRQRSAYCDAQSGRARAAIAGARGASTPARARMGGGVARRRAGPAAPAARGSPGGRGPAAVRRPVPAGRPRRCRPREDPPWTTSVTVDGTEPVVAWPALPLDGWRAAERGDPPRPADARGPPRRQHRCRRGVRAAARLRLCRLPRPPAGRAHDPRHRGRPRHAALRPRRAGVRSRPRPRHLRPGGGGTVRAGAAVEHGRPRPLRRPVQRQAEPGAPLLAQLRPRDRTLLRTSGTGCARAPGSSRPRRPGTRRAGPRRSPTRWCVSRGRTRAGSRRGRGGAAWPASSSRSGGSVRG